MSVPRQPKPIDIPHFLQEPMERRVTLTEKEWHKLNKGSFDRGFNHGYGIGMIVGVIVTVIIGMVMIYLHLSHI